MLGSQYDFHQAGDNRQWISDRLPFTERVIDQLCIIRSMHTDQFNHAPAQLLRHTGQTIQGNPSIGAWSTYGLGSESQNLPGYIVLASGGKTPSAGKSVWGSGFLPSVYQGVQCRSKGDPVMYLSSPDGMPREIRRKAIDAITEINQLSRLTLTATPHKIGRTVASVDIAWKVKPDPTDTKRELEHSKVGRKARREDMAETPALSFPSFGSVKDTQPWDKIARGHAPRIDGRHVPDLRVLADTFRKWCAEKSIPLDMRNIEKTFTTWCSGYSPR